MPTRPDPAAPDSAAAGPAAALGRGKRALRGSRYAPADRVFFVAAALFAALAGPLWAAQWMGWLPAPYRGVPALAHGHELLFGFAGALLAGFLFTKLSRRVLTGLVLAWAGARVAMLTGAPLPVLAVLVLVHPLALLWLGARPFLRAAKSAHNAVPGVVLAVFLVAEVLYLLGLGGVLPAGQERGVLLAFTLVTAMLFVMGGRLIPAAGAGALRAKGLDLPHRVQRPWEMAGVAALAALALGHVLRLDPMAGGAALAAGVCTLVRLARWRGLRLTDRADQWPLHVGTAWLGGGLVLYGVARLSGVPAATTALHAVAIGALGLLGATVAWRTVRQRSGHDLLPARLPPWLAVTFSLAACARLATPHFGTHPALLAAVLWTAGWLALVPRLWPGAAARQGR